MNVSPRANWARGFFRIHFLEHAYIKPGQETHQEDVQNENENIQQQAAIGFGEELCEIALRNS